MYQKHVMTSLPDQSLTLTPQVVLTGSTHWDQPPPPPPPPPPLSFFQYKLSQLGSPTQ